MSTMTRPDCAAMCNLINTHPHPHTHTHTQAQQGAQGLQVRRVERVCHLCRVRSEVFVVSIIDPLIPLGRIDGERVV